MIGLECFSPFTLHSNHDHYFRFENPLKVQQLYLDKCWHLPAHVAANHNKLKPAHKIFSTSLPLVSNSQYKMGFVYIIKPLSTVLSCASNKSQQQQEKNSWDHQESNPGSWVGSKNATTVLCHPPTQTTRVLVTKLDVEKPLEEGTTDFKWYPSNLQSEIGYLCP